SMASPLCSSLKVTLYRGKQNIRLNGPSPRELLVRLFNFVGPGARFRAVLSDPLYTDARNPRSIPLGCYAGNTAVAFLASSRVSNMLARPFRDFRLQRGHTKASHGFPHPPDRIDYLPGFR